MGLPGGESQAVLPSGQGSPHPSWMLLFNTTCKAQRCPKLQTVSLPDEVHKGSWDETNGYSDRKRPLILRPTLLARPALATSNSHLLFMRRRSTYFALPLEFLSHWLLSSSLGPCSLSCAGCAHTSCDPWFCSYLEHVPVPSGPAPGH